MNIIYFLKNVMIDHMTHDLNSKAVRQVRLTFHNNNEAKTLKNVLYLQQGSCIIKI
jgi:folate-binding Fe-S cluster repair protein YgfZ